MNYTYLNLFYFELVRIIIATPSNIITIPITIRNIFNISDIPNVELFWVVVVVLVTVVDGVVVVVGVVSVVVVVGVE